MKYLIAVAIALMIGGSGYYGKQSERKHWAAEVKRVQEQVAKQKEKADADTKQIIQSHTQEVAKLRLRNGSPRRDLGSAVRVQSSCSSTDTTTRQAEPAPRETSPVVTQAEWERINHERFEENRIQLDSLILWVETLYKDYK